MAVVPSDEEVVEAVKALRGREPDLGRPKVLAKLKEQHQWALSTKRLKQLMAVNDLESSHVSKMKNDSSNLDSRLALLEGLEEIVDHYSSSVKPPNCRGPRGTFDVVSSFTYMFNAISQFPAFPDILLYDAYDLKAEHVTGSEEYQSLPQPVIPSNAIAAQLKYRKESTRQLIIYGRGRYNFGITPNAHDGIHYTTIFNRFAKNLPYRVVEEEQRKIADTPAIRVIWEFYEQSALRAGVSREDVARQFEAEWGVNMHEYVPPRLSKDPVIQRAIEFWERERALLYRKCHYPTLEAIRSSGQGNIPVDHRGRVIWDEKKNGIFSLIVTKIDKYSGEECGDLPSRN
ncbi:hypothetical protein PQX77_020724 [Marasmius sp. AFHP31]|nr:hypothetical protein PQX77_020724 [Marasmius sp. AFHP31]